MSLIEKSVFLTNLHHAFAQTDGTYKFPNSMEGDLLRTAKREIEALRAELNQQEAQSLEHDHAAQLAEDLREESRQRMEGIQSPFQKYDE